MIHCVSCVPNASVIARHDRSALGADKPSSAEHDGSNGMNFAAKRFVRAARQIADRRSGIAGFDERAGFGCPAPAS
jgi:hypothetical protein